MLFWLAVLSIGVVLVSTIVTQIMAKPIEDAEPDYSKVLVGSIKSSNSTSSARNWWHQLIFSPMTNNIHYPLLSMKWTGFFYYHTIAIFV